MFCSRCGKSLEVGSRFCSGCGAPQAPVGDVYQGATYVGPTTGYPGQIMRPRYGRKIAGVCAAVARQFDMDPTLVRVIAVILFLVYGCGLLAYVIGWIVIPEEPYALPMGYPAPPPPPTV